MRELGFAFVGAAALIALGLWALGHSDNQEWSDAARITQKSETASPSHTSAQAAGMVAPDNVRLTNQGPAGQ